VRWANLKSWVNNILEGKMKLKKRIFLSLCSFCFTVMTSPCLHADSSSESCEPEMCKADYVVIGVGTAGGLMAKKTF